MLSEMNRTTDIQKIVDWANAKSNVKIVLLTGSWVNPFSKIDELSDYDVILVVDEIQALYDDKTWIEDFGDVLVAYWDPIFLDEVTKLAVTGNVIQYRSGLKIDFVVWPMELMLQITESRKLPDELDMGYRVLLDKIDLTKGLKESTFQAHVLHRPSNEDFQKTIEDFFSDAPYVAKCLLRDELMPAKWCLDYDMKHVFLLPMLEWRAQIDNDWTKTAGVLGKGLKNKLPAEIWRGLEETFSGANLEDNWKSLFASIALFGSAAREVSNNLGYLYPQNLEDRVVAFLMEMKSGEILKD